MRERVAQCSNSVYSGRPSGDANVRPPHYKSNPLASGPTYPIIRLELGSFVNRSSDPNDRKAGEHNTIVNNNV